MSHLLIDSDSLCYRAGFVVNEEGQEALACYQLDEIIEGILHDTGCDTHKLFISGSENFRYAIYPDYKANRSGMVRPLHLQAMRSHLVAKWGASVSSGIEADDAVGIEGWHHWEYGAALNGPVVLAHIDKDIDMIPGDHYNYNKKESYHVDENEAMANFYTQLIQGDKGDNIPGYDGKMRPKLPQFLFPVVEKIKNAGCPEEMFDIVLGMYQEDVEKLDLSARLLWIQRKENDEWTEWLDRNTMEELGREADLIALLQARSAPPVDDGPLNMES